MIERRESLSKITDEQTEETAREIAKRAALKHIVDYEP
jgi:hypothetical protein